MVIDAHRQICTAHGAFLTIVRKGNDEAGAITIKIITREGKASVLVRSVDLSGGPGWRHQFPEPVHEDDADRWLTREAQRDPDIWILEIQGCDGHAFLSDELLTD